MLLRIHPTVGPPETWEADVQDLNEILRNYRPLDSEVPMTFGNLEPYLRDRYDNFSSVYATYYVQQE